MKKILFMSMFLLCSSIAFSQDDDDDDNRYNGIRFGYLWANLISSDETAANNLNSIYVGFARQKKFTPIFRMESGLEFMITGAEVSDDSKLQLYYLVLLVQAHLKFGPFIGTAGLNANFRLHQKITFNGEDVDITDENKATLMDCAADLGVGFKFWILTAEARYYYGFVNIKDGWHNNYLQLGLKVNF